jgi:intracellular sulfur oxidation DsrE/DsrF family protein
MHRFLPGLMLLLLPGLALAADVPRPDDTRSLQGIEEARILWDVTVADPDKLLARLGVIEQTYRDIERQGVTPRMLFGFRGGSVRLLTVNAADRNLEHAQALLRIHDKLAELQALAGVERMEVCSIASRRAGITQADLVEPLVEVGNTFVTAAAYAQRGYARIKID